MARVASTGPTAHTEPVGRAARSAPALERLPLPDSSWRPGALQVTA
jgi:hypothetical protein